MIVADPDLIGCIARESYGHNPTPSFVRETPIKGRSRYRLANNYPSFVVSINIDMSEDQFNVWQGFWAAVGYGTKPFGLYLALDNMMAVQPYLVNAVEPWQAKLDHDGRWVVGMSVEVPLVLAYDITICDVIYGGPISSLAPDDIYGGPIDDLATDVIEPCEGVLQ